MKNRFWRGAAIVCQGIALAGGAQAAFAQDRQGTSDADLRAIDAIVVTAQRRAENVQSSSLSISVLDETKAQTLSDAKDIAALVPGVQISNGGATLQTYVRGVGDFGSSALNQSAVSYNIDGVYVADTTTISTQFYDLERVEVLKGPQGTLYGRNASAGSVNLVYAHPVLHETAASMLFELGNYDLRRGSMSINVPLGGQAAIRASGNLVRRDGYLSDGSDDDRQSSGRLQLLFEPNDAFSLRITGDLSERHGVGSGSVLFAQGAAPGKFVGAVDARNNAARIAASADVYTPGSGLPPLGLTGLEKDMFLKGHQANISAEMNWDLGPAQLTFIPAYRSSDSDVGSYVSGSPFLNQEEVEQQSYELRLSRVGSWGNIVVGAYFLDLDQTTAAQVYTASYITADQDARLGTRSIAVFGQANVDLATGLRAIAGLRFTKEDRTITANDFTNAVAFDSDVTFRKWTWRGGLEYDLSSDNMLYLTASKGFKSGGFNIFAPTDDVSNAYQPETLYSYVIGVRNEFFGHSLRFNVEAFYWDYRDAQQNALQFTPAGNLQFSTFNAAGATLYGIDADLVWRATGSDTITASAAFLDAQFDEFVINPPFPTDPATTACALNNTNPPFAVDCSGFVLPRAPRWSGTASYDHVFALGDDELTLGASLDFASKRYLGINYVSNELADGYVRFNAQAAYSFAGERLTITGYIKNIFNEEVAIAGNQGALTPNFEYAQVAPPRTYGLRLTGTF